MRLHSKRGVPRVLRKLYHPVFGFPADDCWILSPPEKKGFVRTKKLD